MAENLTIARPYAEAVFQEALEKGTFDKWQNMLCALSEACKNAYVMNVIKSSANAEKASENIFSILKDLLDDYGKNFVRILAENSRLEVVPEIYQEFIRLREKHDKVMTVDLISARSFDENEILAIKEKLSQKYNCRINMKQQIDPSIIGGVILKVGDKVIDASIKNSLSALSSTLK